MYTLCEGSQAGTIRGTSGETEAHGRPTQADVLSVCTWHYDTTQVYVLVNAGHVTGQRLTASIQQLLDNARWRQKIGWLLGCCKLLRPGNIYCHIKADSDLWRCTLMATL